MSKRVLRFGLVDDLVLCCTGIPLAASAWRVDVISSSNQNATLTLLTQPAIPFRLLDRPI